MIYYLLHYYFVFYNRDNAEYDSFPQAGDGIASALCTSLINFISLQTFPFRNPTAQRRLRPNLARILYLITKCEILLTSLLFCFYIIVQGSIPFSRVKRKRTQNRVRFLLERETGFGPATSTLARWHSTTESLPHIMLINKHSTVLSPFFEVFLTSVSRRVHLPS